MIAQSPMNPLHLPIEEKKAEILDAFRSHQVLIVAGETGSGKSTQLPKYCLDAGRKNIAVTQPRRIAATSLAARVAQEMGVAVGSTVGYQIRFDDSVSNATRITYMTDGVLLRRIQSDRRLLKYDTIIIDEAHERSLNIDFLLGYLRTLLRERPDLQVIISSATIDTSLFSKAFNNAPVIEVSGRLFPVDVWYRKVEKADDDECADTYVDETVFAIEEIAHAGDNGDILVFLPTERDIREVQQILEGRNLDHCVLMPLYGRMGQAQQHKIFATSQKRKIVLATNVAETSITVPGIKYVIDTGLARISRYVPRLRTTRLPIEPVSRASADQRKGRCGRVANGICIRLYSEQDYLQRDAFTPPEIVRCDMAGAILQMSAMGLGHAEQFPFIEPPTDRAVRDGYAALIELGALDKNHVLTQQGRKMAHLTLDPPIARMVLEAQKRDAIREVAIIAAGLSIVDPRERPAEKKKDADAMHKKFADPQSDFTTYLRLWDTYHDQWETLGTQNKMRRFCREHYLSYNRMREWHDVHEQILDSIRQDRVSNRDNSKPAGYDAIHCSILCGLLSNIAMLEDDGSYRAPRGRTVHLFPGSALFGKRPEWIVCHEVVETSRTFARTVAVIKPEWIEELAAPLLSRQYAAPYFDDQSGTVKAQMTITLYGLTIVQGRTVGYGRANPEEATEIFIREGLFEGRIKTHWQFLHHNQKVRARIETAEAKLRRRGFIADDEAFMDFYRSRLGIVTSIHDLNRIVKEHRGDTFLRMTDQDILASELPPEYEAFPDSITIGGKPFPVRYAFEPGSGNDGITVEVDNKTKAYLDESQLNDYFKQLDFEKIRYFFNNLPKDIRKKIHPIEETARNVARAIKDRKQPLKIALTNELATNYNIAVDAGLFSDEVLPLHLRIKTSAKYEGNTHNINSLPAMQPKQVSNAASQESTTTWNDAVAKYEKNNITSWNFGTLDEKVELISGGDGITLYGYQALSVYQGTINIKIFKTRELASAEHSSGVAALLELALAKELTWVQKDLEPSHEVKLFLKPMGGWSRFQQRIIELIKMEYFKGDSTIRTAQAFSGCVEQTRTKISECGRLVRNVLENLRAPYTTCLDTLRKHTSGSIPSHFVLLKEELKTGLQQYFDNLFNNHINLNMLFQYPRYLKSYSIRINRAFNDTRKYRNNMALLLNMQEKLLASDTETASQSIEIKEDILKVYEMIEEFAISLFATQEVGTRFPISEKKLEKAIEDINNNILKNKEIRTKQKSSTL